MHAADAAHNAAAIQHHDSAFKPGIMLQLSSIRGVHAVMAQASHNTRLIMRPCTSFEAHAMHCAAAASNKDMLEQVSSHDGPTQAAYDTCLRPYTSFEAHDMHCAALLAASNLA
jgi:hypothetical protein